MVQDEIPPVISVGLPASSSCFRKLLLLSCAGKRADQRSLLYLLPKDLSQARVIIAGKPPQHWFFSGIFLMASVKLQGGEQDTEICQLHLLRLGLEAQALKAVSSLLFSSLSKFRNSCCFLLLFFAKNE